VYPLGVGGEVQQEQTILWFLPNPDSELPPAIETVLLRPLLALPGLLETPSPPAFAFAQAWAQDFFCAATA